MRMLMPGKAKIILTAIAVFGGSFLGVVHFTDVCNLEAVTLNGQLLEQWSKSYAMSPDRAVTGQPVDSLAESLIGKPEVFKVDISYSLPDQIDIRTNNFESICFLLDRRTGELYGLDQSARLLSLESCEYDWEHPVLTSVTAGRLFDFCQDVRVNVIVGQLQALKRENDNLYRLIEEIDLGNQAFLKVSLAGLPYRLKVRAECFLEDMNKFMEFVSRFTPELDDTRILDLRHNGMIVCAGGGKK